MAMKPSRGKLFLLWLCLLARGLDAQVLYGSLTGTVQDASGAIVPAATVVITNTGTGQSRNTTTNATGVYLVADLLQGQYDLTITANGFRPYTRKGIEVTVNTVRREDVSLQVGQVSEGITVSAQAQALQTDKTDLHTDLNADAVTNLPLPHYRNFQTLVNLVPGATPGTLQNSLQTSPERGLSTNVNGVNRNNNATRVDGVLSVYLWLSSHVAYVPPAETVETVNISTNSFDAEQGMGGGVQMNVISKSGTNYLHGSAFAFNNNSAVGAKNFFNSGAKPQTNINIYGFTLGGPIKKNKLFFFQGWEGTRERQGYTALMTVATPDQRAGNFSAYSPKTAIYDPASTTSTDGTGRALFPNNVIPTSRLDPIALKIQSIVPLPNLAGITGNFSNSAPQALNRDNFDTKLNYN